MAPAATMAAPAPAPQEVAQQPPAEQFARVVAVKPVKQTSTTSTPRQVCQDVQVVHQEPYKDKNQIGGSAVGAVVGGLLGHQIGGGKGKTLATVGGAVAGGVAGHEIQKKHQENNATYTTTENQCHTVVDKSSHTRTVGYDVTYRYDGQDGHVRMNRDPGVGNGLPVTMTANGPVVTNQ
ncbi:MAG: glycine zipper 2TM domain-containing protein [Proteobacteria bacterium]|nr:glycine zipper 2TM domain-containing protein [Pseudomonadota bacterium]